MEIICKRHIESAAAENQYGDDKQCVNLRFIHLSRSLFLVVCHSTLFKVLPTSANIQNKVIPCSRAYSFLLHLACNSDVFIYLCIRLAAPQQNNQASLLFCIRFAQSLQIIITNITYNIQKQEMKRLLFPS